MISHKYSVHPDSFNKCANKTNFILRSKLELRFVKMIDTSNDVKNWICEPFRISYFFEVDRKYHHYTPDFILELHNGDKVVVEIKPHKKLIKESQKNNEDKIDYIRNMNKWDAITEYCNKHNMIFKIVTEKNLK